MSIKIVVKVMACLALASYFSSTLTAQPTIPPASADPSAQSQTNDSSQQPASQPAPAQPASSQGQSQDQSQDQGNKDQGSKDQSGKDNKPAQDTTQGKVAGTSNDRLFYTLPNFLSVDKGNLPPLSVKDKFKVVALGNFDYIEWPWWAIVAAVSQADNSEPQFRQGWLAYAKRYGTTMGDSSVENFMVGAVFPSMLRIDPRFYQLGKGSFFHRTGYAVSRMVVTRTDSGHAEFNYAEIFGAATAAAISDYTYHPRSTYIITPMKPPEFIPSDRTFRNTVSVWYTQIGLDAITIEIKEFWPDIHRRLQHRFGKPEGQATATQ